MSQNTYGAFPAPNPSGEPVHVQPQHPVSPDVTIAPTPPFVAAGQSDAFSYVPGVGEAGAHPSQSDGHLSVQKTSLTGDYYREMRGEKWRWWMPLISGPLGYYVVPFFLLFPIIIGYTLVSGTSLTEMAGAFSLERLTSDPWAVIFSFGTMAAFLLVIALLLPLIERRRFGSLSSIAGRLRWRIVAKAAGIALLVNMPLLFVSALTEPFSLAVSENIVWVLLAFVIFLPLQCAAEEYMFRGWLVQTLGGWRLPLWLGALISALLFTVVHSQFEFYGYISTFVSGLCLVLLTVYTGGLEAPIAMHTANNAIAALGMFIWGADPTNDKGTTLLSLSADLGVTIAFTLLAAWLIGPKGQGCQKIQWREFLALRPRPRQEEKPLAFHNVNG
ncbi:MAG: type II CAAX endopeptidase family protein [Actinomycetaceae bacterium]|nr:type II CAAX endopeptidase family protein [Actinomycetaceae bacterium]